MKRLMRWMGVFMAVGLMVVTASRGVDEKPAVAAGDMAGVLTQALKEKRVVVFTYKGHARTVEPHALGKGTEGKPVLLAWQTAGGSQTEPPPGWRVFALAEIRALTASEATFAKPRPDFGEHKVGRGLKSVEVEVAME